MSKGNDYRHTCDILDGDNRVGVADLIRSYFGGGLLDWLPRTGGLRGRDVSCGCYGQWTVPCRCWSTLRFLQCGLRQTRLDYTTRASRSVHGGGAVAEDGQAACPSRCRDSRTTPWVWDYMLHGGAGVDSPLDAPSSSEPVGMHGGDAT